MRSINGVITAIFVLLIVNFTNSQVQLTLEMKSYKNTEKTLKNNDYCDTRSRWGWVYICSPLFDICIQNNGMCDPQNYQLGPYKEKGSIEFRDGEALIGQNLKNPLVIPLKAWTAETSLIFGVYQEKKDESKLIWQFVEKLQLKVKKGGTFNYRLTSSRGLVLIFYIGMKCSEFYYEDDCTVYCKKTDGPDGHYTCSDYGEKICIDGWKSPDKDCKDRVPMCPTNPCKNGGTCTEGEAPLNYTCACLPQFKGSQCEIPNPCGMQPCMNGGTCQEIGDKLDNFKCLCPPKFSGYTCQFMDTTQAPTITTTQNAITTPSTPKPITITPSTPNPTTVTLSTPSPTTIAFSTPTPTTVTPSTPSLTTVTPSTPSPTSELLSTSNPSSVTLTPSVTPYTPSFTSVTSTSSPTGVTPTPSTTSVTPSTQNPSTKGATYYPTLLSLTTDLSSYTTTIETSQKIETTKNLVPSISPKPSTHSTITSSVHPTIQTTTIAPNITDGPLVLAKHLSLEEITKLTASLSAFFQNIYGPDTRVDVITKIRISVEGNEVTLTTVQVYSPNSGLVENREVMMKILSQSADWLANNLPAPIYTGALKAEGDSGTPKPEKASTELLYICLGVAGGLILFSCLVYLIYRRYKSRHGRTVGTFGFQLTPGLSGYQTANDGDTMLTSYENPVYGQTGSINVPEEGQLDLIRQSVANFTTPSNESFA